jgi:DNA-binding transcriptional LysR family regulator
MDLRRLEYFVVLAEEGNVRRAAERLHMTASPLSRRIRELEAEIGRSLFDRTADGLRLTDAGRLLVSDARAILRATAESLARVRREATDVLRIGALGPSEFALSDRAATTFRQQFPNAAVQLREGGFADPTVGLVSGTVDAALTLGPLGLPGLLGRVLRTEPLIAAVPASSPLAMRERLNRADLVGALTVRFPSSADDRWRHFWEVDHASRGPLVHSIEECLHAVVWGGAVTLAPHSVAAAHPSADIRFVELDGNEQVDLLLVWRRASSSPILEAYAAAILAAQPATTSEANFRTDHFGRAESGTDLDGGTPV